jgi:SAM-dependent methyltransferase
MTDTQFEFKPIDFEGEETLKSISEAVAFNRWMFDTIKPFCKGEVLEIGSGIGNISEFFIEENYSITLSDIRDNYCGHLQNKFANKSNCKGVLNLDLVAPNFDEKYAHLKGNFDTVFALNVVEHIHDDKLALANCNKLLKRNGHVIILVPAYQTLYNSFDKALEHYRRYTTKTLEHAISPSFDIIHKQYFNVMGIPGWYVSGKLQKNETIPQGQMKLYNMLVPIFKIVDKVFFNKVGLSVVQVGKKVD